MARIYEAIEGVLLPLGRRGENEALEVRVNIKQWIADYGNGAFGGIAQRYGEDEPYPVTITTDGDYACWLVTDVDTAIEGYGKFELDYIVGGVLAKSVIWRTKVQPSVAEPGPVPDPYESWVEDVLAAGASVLNKIDKVAGATAGHLPQLASDGSLTDSGLPAVPFPVMAYGAAIPLTPAAQGEVDYNDFKTPGNWRVGSSAAAGLIANLPSGVAVAHRLFVITMTQPARVVQIIITNSLTAGIYMRYFDGTNWGDWNKFALQAAMDTALANRAALAVGDATPLTPAAQGEVDYNDFRTPGNWRVSNSTYAGRITNCPTSLGHRLYVISTTALDRVVQIIISNAVKPGLYTRIYNGTWSAWDKIVYESDLSNLAYAVYANQTGLVIIPTVDGDGNPTDYDNYVEEGGYQVPSSSRAKQMVNCPTTVAHRMYVSRLYNGSSQIFQTILCADKAMTKFVRRGRAKLVPVDPDDPDGEKTQVVTWQDWAAYKSQEEDHFPVYNQFNSTFPRNVGRIKFGGVAVAGTLPYQGNVKWQTDYYTEEDDITGVVYSSVWRDGLDVFRNLTLETFYSALANPYSVLYTKDYTDKGYRNAHALYGGVCSTYVSAAMGFPLYKTTGQIATYLVEKTMQSVRDIELGDILLYPGAEDSGGHIAFISNTYVDGDGALNGVCVSEETTPVFRTTVVDINDLDAYIKKRHYTVMVPATPIENYPVLDNPVFNKDIIFERGNNTYITQAELTAAGAKALFYVPNGTAETVITVSRNGVDGDPFTLGSVPKESDIPVYNFISKMQDAAKYEFNISGNTGKSCAVTVINPGTIQVSSSGVMELSGWDGCVPCAYYIIEEFASNTITGRGYDPTPGVPPGYSDDYQWVCSYTGNADIIDIAEGAVGATVQIPAAYIAGLNRWKVWLEYDTGCGRKQVFSDIVGA